MGRLVSALTSLPGSYTGSLTPDDNPQSYSLAPGEGQERVDQSSDAVVRSPFVDKVGDGYVEHAHSASYSQPPSTRRILSWCDCPQRNIHQLDDAAR